MRKIKQYVITGIALCLLLGVTGTSGATQINDAQLSVPFSAGTGNSNVNFAVDNNNGVEVGLKAKQRLLGDVTNVGNIYYVPAGFQTIDPTYPTYAKWNFDFSVLYLGQPGPYTVTFKLDFDPTANTFYQTLNFPFGSVPPLFQDSWNYGMGGSGFNANTNGIYDIDLSVSSVTGGLLADSHIQVVVGDGAAPVPEPGTIALLGLGLAGLAVYGKRKQNKQA
jgi:hypothetical protein